MNKQTLALAVVVSLATITSSAQACVPVFTEASSAAPQITVIGTGNFSMNVGETVHLNAGNYRVQAAAVNGFSQVGLEIPEGGSLVTYIGWNATTDRPQWSMTTQ